MKRSRACLGLLLLAFLLLLTAPLVAQTPKAPPSASSHPPAEAAVVPAEEVPQEEAFARMKDLNDAHKLVSTMFGPSEYTGLKRENCHGWRFRGGARLLWESAARYYGLSFRTVPREGNEKTYAAIGIVYAETDFRVGGNAFHKGPYMVYASPEGLWLLTEKGKPVHETFPLENKLDPAEFDKTAKKAPRFTFVQKKDGLFLKIGENLFAVSPQ